MLTASYLSIGDWKTLTDAKAIEPKAVPVTLPSATIRNKEEMDAWLGKARDEISSKLEQGLVVI